MLSGNSRRKTVFSREKCNFSFKILHIFPCCPVLKQKQIKNPVLKFEHGIFLHSSFSGFSILTLRRCLTASVKRYSICPFIERKSSSAQRETSSQSVGESRSKSCFFSFSAKGFRLLSKNLYQ